MSKKQKLSEKEMKEYVEFLNNQETKYAGYVEADKEEGILRVYTPSEDCGDFCQSLDWGKYETEDAGNSDPNAYTNNEVVWGMERVYVYKKREFETTVINFPKQWVDKNGEKKKRHREMIVIPPEYNVYVGKDKGGKGKRVKVSIEVIERAGSRSY